MKVGIKTKKRRVGRVVRIKGNHGKSTFRTNGDVPVSPHLLKELRRDPAGTLANRVNSFQAAVLVGGGDVVDAIRGDILQVIAFMEANGIPIPESVRAV